MSDRIPARFRNDIVRRIGHGGEATVYELAGGRVLRVYHGRPHGAREIAAFYDAIRTARPSFAVPQILEQGAEDGIWFSVDRLIPGHPLHELMPRLAGKARAQALTSYADAAFEIAALPLVRDAYGEFLRDDDSIAADTWSGYLLARMERSLLESPWLQTEVPRMDALATALAEHIRALAPAPKVLAHGDYFPGNVLIADDLSVAGVIDFGPLTVIGEPTLDLASTVIFLEVARPGYTPADTDFVRDRLVARAGPYILDAIDTYRAWYAIRFSPYRNDDPNLYAWCLDSLRSAAADLIG